MSTLRARRERRYADNLRRQDEAVREVRSGRMTAQEAAVFYGLQLAVLRLILPDKR